MSFQRKTMTATQGQLIKLVPAKSRGGVIPSMRARCSPERIARFERRSPQPSRGGRKGIPNGKGRGKVPVQREQPRIATTTSVQPSVLAGKKFISKPVVSESEDEAPLPPDSPEVPEVQLDEAPSDEDDL